MRKLRATTGTLLGFKKREEAQNGLLTSNAAVEVDAGDDGANANKNNALIASLQELIQEATAAVKSKESQMATTGRDDEDDTSRKDQNDIENLNALIDNANSVLAVLGDSSAPPSTSQEVRNLIQNANSIITQVYSDVSATPGSPGKFGSPKKSVSFAEGGLQNVASGELKESGEEDEAEVRETATEVKAPVKETDNRSYLVFMSDFVEEFKDFVVEDVSRLAARVPSANCMWNQHASGLALEGPMMCSTPDQEDGESSVLLKSSAFTVKQHGGGCIVHY
jgi:hypothetical protein